MSNTSVYLGCQIGDEINSSMQLLKGELATYQRQLLDKLEEVRPTVERITSGSDTYASVTIGSTVDSQIKWTAKAPGRDGNQISISYLYLGPEVDSLGNLTFRLPSASVNGNSITCILATDVDGTNPWAASIHLFFWLSNPDVVDLVGGELVGAGTDIPSSTPITYLEGGSSASMKNTETAANEVAKVFGQNNYSDLLKSISVPVVESAEDAKKYLNEDDSFVIVNGKLLIIEGTNMVGINKMYAVIGQNYDTLVQLLSAMNSAPNTPFLLITQNVSVSRIEYICGRPETLTTVSEVYRGYNQDIYRMAQQYAAGDLMSLNLYVFWSGDAEATANNSRLLEGYKIPEAYRGDILVGSDPDPDDTTTGITSLVPVPTVFTVEDPNLLVALKFSKADTIELIEAGVPGIKLPQDTPIDSRVNALRALTRFNKKNLPNGLSAGLSKPVASAQAVNLGTTLDDNGLSRELATRGKACARQDKNFKNESIKTPNFDPINIPTPDLPDAAKQIESAFGALTSVVNTVNRIFDIGWKATVGMFGPLLNKIQNILSLSDNLFKNQLADCLLGTGTGPVGLPEAPDFGSQQSPGISIPDVTGGLPIPTSLLKDALKDLSVDLDISLTSTIETIMGLIRTPLCIVQTMLSAINGFKPPSLGSVLDALNPCKPGKDSESNCPAEDTQEIINASEEMTAALSGIQRIEDLPTQPFVDEVTESVQHFTGFVEKTTEQVKQEIDRGVKQVMDDIQKSLDSKLEQIDQLEQAIKALFGDTSESAQAAEESAGKASGCGSTTVGLFTDAIENFIG